MIFQNCCTQFHELLGAWNLGEFWNIMSGIYAKYHVQFIPLIVYTTTWEIRLTPCVYFSWIVLPHRQANWFWSSCFRPTWSRHWARWMYFSQYFGFPNFPLVLESPDFKIYKSFRHFCITHATSLTGDFGLP